MLYFLSRFPSENTNSIKCNKIIILKLQINKYNFENGFYSFKSLRFFL